jgi:integrase
MIGDLAMSTTARDRPVARSVCRTEDRPLLPARLLGWGQATSPQLPSSIWTSETKGVQPCPTSVRRPKIDTESATPGLDRMELSAFIAQGAAAGPVDHALACLLGLLGRRVSEACGIDIEDLSADRHRTVTVLGKGAKLAVIPMPPRVARAVDLVAGERTAGPLLLTRHGNRMNRHAATRIVRRLARRAGVTKHISPHSLRHSFITAALDAGVPLRDVHIAARHADPRTTTRNDRARNNLDRHASYIVAAFIAGGA